MDVDVPGLTGLWSVCSRTMHGCPWTMTVSDGHIEASVVCVESDAWKVINASS